MIERWWNDGKVFRLWNDGLYRSGFSDVAGSRSPDASDLVDDANALWPCLTTNGTFDILHTGHLDLFRVCRALASGAGVGFVVGLNSDCSVKRYKGPERPLVSAGDRAEMVLEASGADAVVVFYEDTPDRLIRALRPIYHVNDAKYGEDCVEKKSLDAVGCRLVMLSQARQRSTTGIVEAARGGEKRWQKTPDRNETSGSSR